MTNCNLNHHAQRIIERSLRGEPMSILGEHMNAPGHAKSELLSDICDHIEEVRVDATKGKYDALFAILDDAVQGKDKVIAELQARLKVMEEANDYMDGVILGKSDRIGVLHSENAALADRLDKIRAIADYL